MWASVDPMAEKYPEWSPYNYTLLNPVNMVDPDGKASVSNHYWFAYGALTQLGYSGSQRDLVSHYSSVYADHPSAIVRFVECMGFREGIDYSDTELSQTTSSRLYSSWHSMSADGESISPRNAMKRGQAFGWGKIIEAGTASMRVGGIRNLRQNSRGMKALGQGVHALVDAVFHKGEPFGSFLDKIEHINNDMDPSIDDIVKSISVSYNAILVAEVLSGDYRNLQDGMRIDLSGTTTSQYNQIRGAFQKAVSASNTDALNKIILFRKSENATNN